MTPLASRSQRSAAAIVLGACTLFVPHASAQTAAAHAAPGAPAASDERTGFVMDERPSLRFGRAVRLGLTSQFDFEWRGVDDEDGDAAFGRRRIGVDGRLFDRVVFEVAREFSDDEQPWRDAFVEYRAHRGVRVRAGRFKVPFGAERLTPGADLDFAQRTALTAALTPGRDTGLQVSGRLFGRGLGYAAGVFRHDGDVSREGTEAPGGATIAGRLTTAPLAWTSSKTLRQLELGVAATHGDVPEGRNGWRVRTGNGFQAFSPMYVAGARRRVAVEAAFDKGPVAFRGEWLRVEDERRGQGLSGDDLPALVGTGWHAGGTWFAVGRVRENGAPRRALFDGGIGAVQLAFRAERVAVHSVAAWDDPFRNPRAAHVMPNDLGAWTAGVNWYPVRFVKLQLNVVREHLADAERRPDPSRAWTTTRVFRVQFAL